jgi:hypothetical protein
MNARRFCFEARTGKQLSPSLTALTQLGLDRLPYTFARSISKICIRRCEPVHIGPTRLVAPSTGALQRGREKNAYPPSCPRDVCDHLRN